MAAPAAAASVDVTSLPVIRVGGVPEHFNLPWQLAQEQHLFAAAGVRVEWHEFKLGTGAMIAALKAGEVDLIVALTEGLVGDIAQQSQSQSPSASLKILGTYVESPLTWAISTGAHSAFNEVADLRGQSIGISRFTSGSHLMTCVLATQRGWDQSDVKYVVLGSFADLRAGVNSGAAAAFMWEHFTSKPYYDSGEIRRIGQIVTPWPAFLLCSSRAVLADTTEPAVIVEDEKNEEDTKPVIITAVPETAATTEAVDSAPAASASDAPAPESAAPAAAVAPVIAPAAPQTDWFYLDDTALERGPFPSSDMAAWFTAGFFTAATKVRTASEKEFKAFGERSAEQESFMKPSTAPAAAPVASSTAAAPVNIEDQFETDMMDDEDEQDDQGEEGEEDTEQKATDKPDAAEEKKSDSATAADSKDAPAAIQKLISPALLAWFYVDTDGKEQGPFTPASMLKWHRANFFAFNDTPLRRMDEETATPLSKRTTAPSFFSAILPRPPVARENRWYYLDARGTEQGPFTEVQMRGWWLGGFLKPSLRVRQVGEDESAFKEISERTGEHECAFTKGENPAPLLPTPGAQTTNMQPQQQQPQSQYPSPYLAHHHAQPQQPAPYGYAAPSAAPYWSGPGAAHPYAYAGHNPYGSPYGAPPAAAAPSGYRSDPYGAPPPPRDRHWNASGDYAQSAAFSGHRGRGRHVVGGAYADSRVPHDPLSTYAHPAALEAWQEEQNKRARR